MMRRASWVLVVGAASLLMGCGGDDPENDADGASTFAPAAPAPMTPLPVSTLPPPPATTTNAAPMPPTGTTVVLDPGHNGGNAANPAVINRQVPDGRGGTKPCNTTGTSTDAGYPEHAFTWDVANRVREILGARGVNVVLTRADDDGVGPCVDERAAVGNRLDAAAVVSIHADGAGAGGRGFHIIYSAPPLYPVQRDTSLAGALAQSMRAGGFVNSTYRGSGGLDPRSDIAGVNSSTVPAVMVEAANMRNAEEAARVSSPAGRAFYAEAIAAGILTWLAAR